MKVLKAKFNSYRRPEYRMATLVVEDGLSAHVVKRALDERALPHLQGLAEKCQRTQETYPRIKVLRPTIDGGEAITGLETSPSLQAVLAGFLKRGDDEGFRKEVKRYVETVSAPVKTVDDWWASPGFQEVFGAVEESDMTALPCLNPANIDLDFSNIHVAEGSDPYYRLFDCEWTFDFAVPLGYVLWRSLSRFEKSFRIPMLHGWRASNLYGLAGIEESDVRLYESFERGFQRFVFGETLYYGIPDAIVQEKPWRNFDDLVSWGQVTQGHYEAATARAAAIEQAYEHSFSWRVTKPLRALTGGVRRLLGR